MFFILYERRFLVCKLKFFYAIVSKQFSFNVPLGHFDYKGPGHGTPSVNQMKVLQLIIINDANVQTTASMLVSFQILF